MANKKVTIYNKGQREIQYQGKDGIEALLPGKRVSVDVKLAKKLCELFKEEVEHFKEVSSAEDLAHAERLEKALEAAEAHIEELETEVEALDGAKARIEELEATLKKQGNK